MFVFKEDVTNVFNDRFTLGVAFTTHFKHDLDEESFFSLETLPVQLFVNCEHLVFDNQLQVYRM